MLLHRDDNTYTADQEVTYDDFYNDLSPYGTWMDYPSYGRVWICNVPGFAYIVQADTGYLPVMAGHGLLITTGAGRRSTMAAGLTKVDMAGCRFPVMNGSPAWAAGAQIWEVCIGLGAPR